MPVFGLKNFRLMGQGLTASVPWVKTWGADAGMQGIGWSFGAGIRNSVYFGLPASVSPSQISAIDWQASGLARVFENKSFEIGFGYEVLSRSAQATTPQPVLTSYLAHGPSAQISMNSGLGAWSLATRLRSTIPWVSASLAP